MDQSLETRLAGTDPSRRRRLGVYYTPLPVARVMVEAVHHRLIEDLGWPDGLAQSETSPMDGLGVSALPGMLEPSLGDGIFAREIICRIHQILMRKWEREGFSSDQRLEFWNRYVPQALGPRLHAIEIMPEAIETAKEKLSAFLKGTGFRGPVEQAITIHHGNALEESTWEVLDQKFAVVIGNPPYCSASTNRNSWLDQMLKGELETDIGRRSYFHLGTQSLGERKLWLGDDYVKFFRLAQWLIDRGGCGVLALVTNHGYLDNITFRAMRNALISQFDRIEIIDLQGNRRGKHHEQASDVDENVFEIEQGTAIGLFSRSPSIPQTLPVPKVVRFGSLGGTRADKLSALEAKPLAEIATTPIEPTLPNFFFRPRNTTGDSQYGKGIPLLELMPNFSSAVVTARDHLVIDTDRDRLLERLARLRDLAVSDDDLRRELFPRPRSQKYPPGDTRGWKLAIARKVLREDPNWEQKIQQCLYRPFDRRWIYWSSAMVDWPRGPEMAALQDSGNLGLIVRRQFPPSHPATFFFVTDTITIDGVLRNDNRGNETVLPLWLDGRPNVHLPLLRDWLAEMDLEWNHSDKPAEPRSFGPEDLLALVYALFHCGDYRTRFAQQLEIDFPRVLLPAKRDAVWPLVKLGKELLDMHLASGALQGRSEENAGIAVESGYPRYREGAVWINSHTQVAEVSESIWQMTIGGHQVARKWLRDRRGHTLSAGEWEAYREIIDSLSKTAKISAEIQSLVDRLGGFDQVFGLTET